MIKAYKYRIYPTKEQKVKIDKTMGACRWVYNWALGKAKAEYDGFDTLNWLFPSETFIKKDYYKLKPKVDIYKLSRELTQISKTEDKKWLREVENMALRLSLDDLDSAYKNFFNRLKKGKTGKKSGFPKFKSKKDIKLSYRTYESTHKRQYANFQNHTISIPKIGKIKAVLHRYFKGKVNYITVTRDNLNQYYVSITVDDGKKDTLLKPINKETTIGLDLGIKNSVILSNDQKFDNPKYFEKSKNTLTKLQRRLSKRRGTLKSEIKSHRYKKLNHRINKLYKKITRQREYFYHNLSSQLTNDNQISLIGIEDLNVEGMLQNSKLSKSISDVAWSTFITMLKYKAKWKGITVIEIDRFAPSSQLCNHCGFQNKDLKLQDRSWVCPQCNTEHDRDINAAINIKNIGLKQIGRFTTELTDVESSANKDTRRNVKCRNLHKSLLDNDIHF